MARNAKPGKKGKKKGSVTVDFEGVESGGRSIADGWASGKITEAELKTAESSGNEMFAVQWAATRGKEKAKVFDNVVLTPNALWKLKSLLEACGAEVSDGEMEVSADDLVDLECDIEITNEEYEGRDRPRITGFAPAGTHTGEGEEDDEEEEDEDEEEEEEEEETPKKKSKAKSKSDDDEDEDDEEEEEEEEEDDDSDDEDEDEDDDEESDEDEDEDEEDEKPKKKGKKSAKLRAGMKVKFEDDKGKTRSGVITSIDDDTVNVEDSKGDEWELSIDEITVA